MNYSTLSDLITYLQYGNNLHIGVLFFGEYGNDKLTLPHKQKIHASPVCEVFKARYGKTRKCNKCRELAIKKAMTTKEAFEGLCINGIYEYTSPVIIDENVACIIYIGNILDSGKGRTTLKRNLKEKEFLLDSMEKNFSLAQCQALSSLLESYIRFLLEKFPAISSNAINPLIVNIKNYITANLEFHFDSSHIAEVFHYNEHYLRRLFKKETGMNFSDFVNRQRLDRAKFLLTHSDDTILSISNQVGYNNVTYFNRLFKKNFGITPTAYRLSEQSHSK